MERWRGGEVAPWRGNVDVKDGVSDIVNEEKLVYGLKVHVTSQYSILRIERGIDSK